jgi:hypothetical protein
MARRPQFGFLFGGLIFGFAAGMGIAKHDHGHAVEAIIAGLILGPVSGALLESHYLNRRQTPPRPPADREFVCNLTMPPRRGLGRNS